MLFLYGKRGSFEIPVVLRFTGVNEDAESALQIGIRGRCAWILEWNLHNKCIFMLVVYIREIEVFIGYFHWLIGILINYC